MEYKTDGGTGSTITGNNLITSVAGKVTVTATIINGLGENEHYTQDFKITVTAAIVNTYEVSIGIFCDGSVSADITSNITAGEIVTLTVGPDEGYELTMISVYKTGDVTTIVETLHETTLNT